MKKKILIIFLFLFICSVSVFGDSTYSNYGGDRGDFSSLLPSTFNEDNTNARVYDTEFVPNALKSPLVEDLDGDGTKEIIVLTKFAIYLYNTSISKGVIDLNPIVAFSTSNTGTERDFYSNLILFDIDNDGIKEIIFHSDQTGNIYMLEFNGTHLINESSLSLTYNYNVGDPIISSNSVIQCGDTYATDNKCVLIGNDQSSVSGVGTRQMTAYLFNSTHLNTAWYTRIENGGLDPYCFNRENGIVFANDYYYLVVGNDQNFYFHTLDTNRTHLTIVRETGTGAFNNYGASGCGRFWAGDSFYSSILVYDYFGTSEKELIIGFNSVVDSYRIKVFTYDGFALADGTFPEASNNDGEIISNPFVTNVFYDTGIEDVCILGFLESSLEFEATCISSKTNMMEANFLGLDFDPVSSLTFNIIKDDISFYPNNTNVFGFGVHSIESKQGGVSEFLTSHGVLELEVFDLGSWDCDYFGNCDFVGYIYDFPIKTPVSVIPVDYFDDGYDDLLFLTENNLKYYDDGFTNVNAYLEYCTEIEPNPNSVWALHINSSHNNEVRVTTKGNDINSDLVSTKAVLYYGEINEQSTGWSPNATGGVEYTHQGLLPNETTSNSILRIYYRDVNNYFDSPNYEDYIFRVALDGDYRGDSSLCVGFTGEEAYNFSYGDNGTQLNGSCVSSSNCADGLICYDSVCVTEPTLEDNKIKESLESFSFLAGVPLLVLILIIFGAITYAVFKERSISNGVKLPVIIILNLFGLGIAIYLGLLSVLFLVILVIVVIALISVVVIRIVGR